MISQSEKTQARTFASNFDTSMAFLMEDKKARYSRVMHLHKKDEQLRNKKKSCLLIPWSVDDGRSKQRLNDLGKGSDIFCRVKKLGGSLQNWNDIRNLYSLSEGLTLACRTGLYVGGCLIVKSGWKSIVEQAKHVNYIYVLQFVVRGWIDWEQCCGIHNLVFTPNCLECLEASRCHYFVNPESMLLSAANGYLFFGVRLVNIVWIWDINWNGPLMCPCLEIMPQLRVTKHFCMRAKTIDFLSW